MSFPDTFFCAMEVIVGMGSFHMIADGMGALRGVVTVLFLERAGKKTIYGRSFGDDGRFVHRRFRRCYAFWCTACVGALRGEMARRWSGFVVRVIARATRGVWLRGGGGGMRRDCVLKKPEHRVCKRR